MGGPSSGGSSSAAAAGGGVHGAPTFEEGREPPAEPDAGSAPRAVQSPWSRDPFGTPDEPERRAASPRRRHPFADSTIPFPQALRGRAEPEHRPDAGHRANPDHRAAQTDSQPTQPLPTSHPDPDTGRSGKDLSRPGTNPWRPGAGPGSSGADPWHPGADTGQPGAGVGQAPAGFGQAGAYVGRAAKDPGRVQPDSGDDAGDAGHVQPYSEGGAGGAGPRGRGSSLRDRLAGRGEAPSWLRSPFTEASASRDQSPSREAATPRDQSPSRDAAAPAGRSSSRDAFVADASAGADRSRSASAPGSAGASPSGGSGFGGGFAEAPGDVPGDGGSGVAGVQAGGGRGSGEAASSRRRTPDPDDFREFWEEDGDEPWSPRLLKIVDPDPGDDTDPGSGSSFPPRDSLPPSGRFYGAPASPGTRSRGRPRTGLLAALLAVAALVTTAVLLVPRILAPPGDPSAAPPGRSGTVQGNGESSGSARSGSGPAPGSRASTGTATGGEATAGTGTGTEAPSAATSGSEASSGAASGSEVSGGPAQDGRGRLSDARAGVTLALPDGWRAEALPPVTGFTSAARDGDGALLMARPFTEPAGDQEKAVSQAAELYSRLLLKGDKVTVVEDRALPQGRTRALRAEYKDVVNRPAFLRVTLVTRGGRPALLLGLLQPEQNTRRQALDALMASVR